MTFDCGCAQRREQIAQYTQEQLAAIKAQAERLRALLLPKKPAHKSK